MLPEVIITKKLYLLREMSCPLLSLSPSSYSPVGNQLYCLQVYLPVFLSVNIKR